MQIEQKQQFSPKMIKKSLSKFSPSNRRSIKKKSFNIPKAPIKETSEIESPSKLVEKIYVNMGDTQENERIPEKKEFSLTRRNKDKIISKSSVPGKKDLYLSSKYSHLKKSFIKEYFYPKEDDDSEKNDINENNKFENVIFSDLSATALASHKWRRKTAQNNAYLMKSFSPEFVDYPNSPKFSQYDSYIRNFNRIERMNGHCLSKHVGNNNKFEKRLLEVERPHSEYLRNFSQNERKTQMIFGMNYQEYEDVINLWKIDHLKGEIPDIRQAYDYMKIIKNSKQKKNETNKINEKNKPEKKEYIEEKNNFIISPKMTNRSGLQLIPKNDTFQINISSPIEKNMTHSFFSPINTSQSIKKRSPRFSAQSPSRTYSKSPESRKAEFQMFSLWQ